MARHPHDDAAINPVPEEDAAPGLEGIPRADMGVLEESVPTLVDRALRGPVVLTRNGTDAFVLLPIDIYRRLWASTPRPPVVDA